MLTITLSSNLVKPGTRRAVGRGRWPGGVLGCVRGVRGCLCSVVGCFGRVSGCLIRAFIGIRTIPPILTIRTAAHSVSELLV